MNIEHKNNRRPKFFMLGAPKCGTTALASYLAMHPALQVSQPKEPNYFCKDLRVGQLPVTSDEEYLAKFFPELDGLSAAAALDGSVWYLYSQVAVDEILRFQPDAHFLVMLRNPVDMAYSLHSMFHFMGQEDVFDFARAWRLENERSQGQSLPARHWVDPLCIQYKAACSLGTQLERLFEKVDRSRVHIELQEDLQADAQGVYTRVLHFMEIADDGRNYFPMVNAGRKLNSPFLVSALRSSAAIAAAKVTKRMLGLKTLGVGRLDMPMRPDQRRWLVVAFRDEISRMEDLLERNFSHWCC